MGRDYCHGTGKGVRGGGRGGGGGDPTVATGCVSSVFRFFDFHHFQLCYHLNHHQQHGNLEHLNSPSSTPQSLKGLEAPRNSLESLDAMQADSASSISKSLSENLTIPQMSVKTTRIPQKTSSLLSSEELSEDGFSSPGSRTPSLVARLMGLDLLPEAASPAFSTSASSTKTPLPHTQPCRKQMKNSGTQSLPESPRISLARWSDVDLHHRLSLQVSNKDGSGDDEALYKRREMIKRLVQNSEAEGWSPGHYAKQIVKQVKESVGRSRRRRVGLAEITNTVKGRETSELRRDEHLLPAVAKNNAKTTSPSLSSQKSSQKKTATNFRSEEDVENQAPINNSNTQKHLPVSPSTSSITPTAKRETTSPLNEKKTAQKLKCKKAVEDKFKSTACPAPAATANGKTKKTERDSLFIRPTSPSPTANQHRNKGPIMSKKTTLSTEQFNITTTATRTGLHRIKQVVVASDNQKGHPQQRQLQLEKQIDFTEAKPQRVGEHENIGQYVSKILKCMGIGNHTRINTISNWFSPSHPLNPSIFNLLEPISSTTSLTPQCNRRLIFQLTDEILADILHPTTGHDIMRIMHINGDQLVNLLTLKMESFPLSNCKVLQDVDALVGSDYDRVGSLDDENGSVVREVEREILDCLLFETTALL